MKLKVFCISFLLFVNVMALLAFKLVQSPITDYTVTCVLIIDMLVAVVYLIRLK